MKFESCMNTNHYLASDLGTKNGRIILGTLTKGQLTLQEIHSFEIRSDLVKGVLCWDLVTLEKDIFEGIEKAAALGLPISGLSASSWGWGLRAARLEGPRASGADLWREQPARCRDGKPAQEASPRRHLRRDGHVARAVAYPAPHRGGAVGGPGAFPPGGAAAADRDYLNTRFSGVAACEESLASTTQLYNPQTHSWSPKVAAALDLPGTLLPRLVPSGTAFGPVVEELRRHPALVNARVVATCSHDKAAAIARDPGAVRTELGLPSFRRPGRNLASN